MNIGDVSGSVARRSQRAEAPFDNFPVRDHVICHHRLWRSLLQQSPKQYEGALLGNMFAEPATKATGGRFTGEKRLLTLSIVDARSKFALEEGGARRMVVVPMREQNCLQRSGPIPTTFRPCRKSSAFESMPTSTATALSPVATR